MPRRRKRGEAKVDVPVAPMIDVVFLLLIYFMVASTLERQEADLSFQLPGTAEQDEPLNIPDEQIIEIRPNGQVVVNDYPYDSPGAERLTELASMLRSFRRASEANRVEAIVTVAPADETPHARIVRVMDACAKAGIDAVNFALEAGEGGPG